MFDALTMNAAGLAQLEALNASGSSKCELIAVPLIDGRFALNADLLTDLATWHHYADFLAGLPRETIDYAQIVQPEGPS